MQGTKRTQQQPLNNSSLNNSPMKSSIHLSDIVNRATNKYNGGISPLGSSPQKSVNSPFGASTNFSANAPEIPANIANNPAAMKFLSKMQARKDRQSLMTTAMANRRDPSSFLMEQHEQAAAENSRRNPSKEMEENFQSEKKTFLSKLNEENQLLVQLFEVKQNCSN
jgi:hypothetical protein